ncbi:MAG: TIGR04255 family protein [Kiritimatiellia bacterium]
MKRYKDPPIVEAVCEFRLSRDTPWDLAVPGLLYERLKEQFPNREQRLVQEVETVGSPQGIQHQIRSSERIMLFGEGRRAFVQLGPYLLAINILKPYPSWPHFKQTIGRVWESLWETIEVKGLERIGLRYINRIEVPSPIERLKDYFAFYVFLGERLPQRMASFLAGGEFIFAEGRDRCRVQLSSATADPQGRTELLLDIDYFLARPNEVYPQDAIGWIEEAHNQVEHIFEGCITDTLRELFHPVEV